MAQSLAARRSVGFTPTAQCDDGEVAAWSPDGTHVVASLHAICLSRCTSWLLLIDVETGSETVLASASDFIGMARHTPDGQTIAITTGGRLYVLPLPDA